MARNIFFRIFICLTVRLSVRGIVCSNGKMNGESKNQFYKNVKIYWSNIPATDDAMVGGSGSDIDLNGSRAFLNQIFSNDTHPGSKLALDCGAGIGRITKNVLMPLFDKVDLVEQDDKFANAAVLSIGADHPKLGTVYNLGLQDFHPDKKYDVVWIQWVLCQLSDKDLSSFLVRIRDALNENGVICIKENITGNDNIHFDEIDSTVTRPYKVLMKFFEKARLRVIHTKKQEGFPEFYAIQMFAVVPIALDLVPK